LSGWFSVTAVFVSVMVLPPSLKIPPPSTAAVLRKIWLRSRVV